MSNRLATMVWDYGIAFQVLAVCNTWLVTGAVAVCDSAVPVTETAYVGAYEIRFPDLTAGNTGPPHCSWLISAYRNDYVIHLQFDDVNLPKNSHDACMDEISVYDGSKTTDNVITTFCGTEQPRLITSSQTVLVVFSSNRSSIDNGTFRLRYKAVKDRSQPGDTGQILRIGFGSFVGAIACFVIASWTYRKYKHEQLNRGRFVFGRQCGSSGRGRQNVDPSARTEPRREARDGQGSLQIQSFKNTVAGFFQDVAIMFSPRRMTVGSLRTESTDSSNHHHQQQSRQQPHCGSENLRTLSNSDYSSHANNDNTHTLNISRNQFPERINNTQVDSVNDHMTFGYPMVPLNSFTSDPNAVRPPTYEDCIKSANPLYLHPHGRNMFYNMAFTLKDEEMNRTPIVSPPPPYTETSSEIPQAIWGQPTQEPPLYEASSASSAATTPDQERTGYDSSAPEQCCERGETVMCLSPSHERPVVVGGRINATAQLPDACVCESLVAATIVQPIATLELAGNFPLANLDLHHQPAVETAGTRDGVPCHVSLDNAHPVRAASSAPVDLLRRSGLLSSHSSDRPVASEDRGNQTPGNEVTISQTDCPASSHSSHDRSQV